LETPGITGGDEAQRNCQSELMRLCTPGMGVNLWGESPLYVNRLSELVLSSPKETRTRGGVGRGS